MSEAFASLCWTPAPPPHPRMAQIVSEVAAKHGLTVAELKGPGRAQRVSKPRQEAMHQMHSLKRWSLSQIGGALGGRDHTTVLHGVRQHAKRLAAQ